MKLGDKVIVQAIHEKAVKFIDFDELLKDSDYETIDQQIFERVEKQFEGIVCGKRVRAVKRTWEYGWLGEPIYGGEDVGYSFIDEDIKKGQRIIDTMYEPFYLVAKNLTGFYLVKAEDMEVHNGSQ
ncbi:hypothetical protein NST92_05290 [Bacillus sp. FSL R5-0586]|uniref:hypothetical protein n=1 Tax=Bacillus sp. FSL R5-0586 TaxID=2954559 RepID=UPI0002E6BC30